MVVFINGDDDRKEDGKQVPHVIFILYNKFEDPVLGSPDRENSTKQTL